MSLVISENQALRNQGSAISFALNLIAIPLCFFCLGMWAHAAAQHRSLPSLLLGTIKLYGIGILLYAPKQVAATASPDLSASIQALLWGTGNSLYNTPLWLLAALAPGLCLYRLSIAGGWPVGKHAWGLLIPLTLIGTSYWLMSLSLVKSYMPHDAGGQPIGWPLSLDLSPLVASLLLLGAWYQARRQEAPHLIHTRWATSLSMLVASVTFLVMLRFDPALDLNYRMIQSWPAALLATLLGITMCVTASQLLCTKVCKARHPLALLGRNGLIILLVFAPIQNAVINALPAHAQQSPTTVVAASIILCLLIAGLWQHVVNRHSLIKRIAYV